MTLSGTARWILGAAVALVLVVTYIPLAIVVISSVNAASTFSWPPQHFTLHWWKVAWTGGGALDAVQTSLEVGAVATLIALHDIGGRLYRAALKRTGDKEKNYWLTLFLTEEEKATREVRGKFKRIR